MNLVVFEGLDYSGKSSALKELKKRKSYEYIFTQTPRQELRKLKNCIDGIKDEEVRIIYYLIAALENSFLSQNSGKCIISDRYYFTTLVYESLFTGKSMAQIKKDHDRLFENIVEPDLVFFFHVSEKELMRRIKNRGITGSSDHLMSNRDNREILYSKYKEFFSLKNWTIIDTTNMTVEEEVDIIFENIDRLLKE